MPITPDFVLSQSSSEVVLRVHVPHVRVAEAECIVLGSSISFHCRPYLLRLELPGECVDDDRVVAKYDPNDRDGTLTVHIPKLNPGEEFSDLHMVGKLLAGRVGAPVELTADIQPTAAPSSEARPAAPDSPVDDLSRAMHELTMSAEQGVAAWQRRQAGPPLIEVLSSTDAEAVDEPAQEPAQDSGLEEQGDAEDSAADEETAAAAAPVESHRLRDTSLLRIETLDTPRAGSASAPSQAPSVPDDLGEQVSAMASNGSALEAAGLQVQLRTEQRYGFNDGYSGVFAHLQEMVALVMDVPDIEQMPTLARRAGRQLAEQREFDVDRFLGDYAHGTEDPLYIEAMGMEQPLQADDEARDVVWTDEERAALRSLPRKELLMDAIDHDAALRAMVSILCAAAYDWRITGGDGSVESSWTVVKLSSALAWCDVPTSPQDAVLSFVRRALCYAYMRRYDLACQCVVDVATWMKSGREACLRQLLRVQDLFAHDDNRYLLNKIWIHDLCIWLQHVSADVVSSAGQQVAEVLAAMQPDDCGWPIAAYMSIIDASDDSDSSELASSDDSSDSDSVSDSDDSG